VRDGALGGHAGGGPGAGGSVAIASVAGGLLLAVPLIERVLAVVLMVAGGKRLLVP